MIWALDQARAEATSNPYVPLWLGVAFLAAGFVVLCVNGWRAKRDRDRSWARAHRYGR